jgi:hypothetical protein
MTTQSRRANRVEERETPREEREEHRERREERARAKVSAEGENVRFHEIFENNISFFECVEVVRGIMEKRREMEN